MSSDDYARAIIAEGERRGITERGVVMALSTALVESSQDHVLYMWANYGDPESLNYPHDKIGSDENSVGLFQQRAPWWGTCADRMDPARSAGMFYDELAKLDYTDTAQSPGWYCYQVQDCAEEYAGRYDERMPEAQELYDRLTGDVMPSAPNEIMLNYDHSITPQETGYWCGPAATQVVLNGQGIIVSEQQLANEMGTHMGGTDDIVLVTATLARYVPQGNYSDLHIPHDPPTAAERDALWAHIVNSIDGGRGVVMNWVAPEGNKPVGVKGSMSPMYSGGTTFHYVACMGYDDNPALRACWIADSGFKPFGYWCAFDQVATLIPPKGYAYAAAPAAVKPPPEPAPAPPAELTHHDLLQQVWDQLCIPWPQLGNRTLVDAVAELLGGRRG